MDDAQMQELRKRQEEYFGSSSDSSSGGTSPPDEDSPDDKQGIRVDSEVANAEHGAVREETEGEEDGEVIHTRSTVSPRNPHEFPHHTTPVRCGNMCKHTCTHAQ